MRLLIKKSTILCLVTTLIVAFNIKLVIAFSIRAGKGAIYHYKPVEPYPISSRLKGVTFLNTKYVTGIKPIGFNKFKKFLDPNYDEKWKGWSFKPASKELRGNFVVKYYYACGTTTHCATQANNQVKAIDDKVGAYIDIKYNPATTDPQPSKKLQWIQFIRTNHSRHDAAGVLIPNGVHGLLYQGLDTKHDGNNTPYYPGRYNNASGFGFFDRPARNDPSEEHYWYAEMFLVEQQADDSKEVVVYNGVRWGWENRIYAINNSCPIPINPSSSDSVNLNDSVSRTETTNLNCPPPPPPPLPDTQCLIDSSVEGHWVYGPCPISAAPTGTDEVSKVSWGFGVGSDYLS